MTHDHYKGWLTFTAILVMAFGPVFPIGAYLPLSEPARLDEAGSIGSLQELTMR